MMSGTNPGMLQSGSPSKYIARTKISASVNRMVESVQTINRCQVYNKRPNSNSAIIF